MKFDQTYIAIRKRSLMEILDLTLHVIRDHFGSLAVLWLLGIAPFLIVDWLLLNSLASDMYDLSNLTVYFFLMTMLICCQAQVGTTFMTSYLGQATFSQKPSIRGAIAATLKVHPYFLWVHGVLRMIIPLFVFVVMLNDTVDDDSYVMLSMLIAGVTALSLLVRCFRPFASEILLLEKTPILKRDGKHIHYSLRSRNFHAVANAELLGRFALTTLLCFPLTLTVLGCCLLMDSTANLITNTDYLPIVFYGPLSMWLVAGAISVSRFLSYIDIRIRQEGWEVELRMRAEAAQLSKTLGDLDWGAG